ncbi:TPA: 30S ribosomal protein S8 [Candidatus Dependentiae bacterium]|nr:MAG: 30S ribosomal protein S8 [candidate division TM6 bacterium GW2011_GWF2_43_87]HBL98452.1 30S ribosomal protein S8 [Candidatus Dependentiae bacterium]
MSIDTIGNFLTSVRNAIARSKQWVEVPYSRINAQIAEILKSEGFVKDFAIMQREESFRKQLRVYLKYVDGESVIHEIDRASTPGRRVYEGASKLRRVVGGLGVAIVTTSSGLMTDKEARQRKVGGEVLCTVW